MMVVMKRSATIRCPDGLSMGLDVYLPEAGDAPLPVTVLCHGFKGFKDWGLFPPLAERLAARGRAIAVYDASHNGTSGATPGTFDRLDLFEKQTLARHVADLGTVLDFLDTSELAAQCRLQRNRHFNVVGHSMGGAVAVLRAADDGRVVQLATLNGMASLQRFSPEQLAQVQSEGRVLIRNQRTGQDMPLGRDWFSDAPRHDLEEAATQVFVPALVVCAQGDESVPFDESRRYAEWIAGSRLVAIPGSDHVFGARHPFAGWTPALERVAAELDEFLPHTGRLGGI